MDQFAARARLEQLLAELESSADVLQHVGAHETGESSAPDQHAADSGTDLAEADREEASLAVVLGQAERVREALARIDAGTYGSCVACGRELPEERLEARPEAARCVDCQQRAENLR